METKCFEVRDASTFMPVICIHPVAANAAQRYLLHCDGYSAGVDERCIIVIAPQCRGVAYDPYNWPGLPRTMRVAHAFIEKHWHELEDGDVIDVEFISGETQTPKVSEVRT